MPKTVKCPICGQVFVTSRPNKRYCSFVCREAGSKLRRLKWESKNPEYQKEYMRKRRQEEKSNHDREQSS